MNKNEKKLLKRFETFLSACNVTATHLVHHNPNFLAAHVGNQLRGLKKTLAKDGWTLAESHKYGGGETEAIYTHPKVRGAVSLIAYRSSPENNKFLAWRVA